MLDPKVPLFDCSSFLLLVWTMGAEVRLRGDWTCANSTGDNWFGLVDEELAPS